jgi:monoamine oxidase
MCGLMQSLSTPLEGANTRDSPVFLAGSDLSEQWAGWVDGAITSGYTAAAKAIRYMIR